MGKFNTIIHIYLDHVAIKTSSHFTLKFWCSLYKHGHHSWHCHALQLSILQTQHRCYCL